MLEDQRKRELATAKVGFNATNALDTEGNPTGGSVKGTGIWINWQDGPLGRGEERQLPNGAFVEDVIAAARQRIQFYQDASSGRFACEENALALEALNTALAALDCRTKRREDAGTEGTHQEEG